MSTPKPDVAQRRPVTAMDDGEPSMSVPTSKEALGDTAPQRPHDAPGDVPKGFMASTWHHNTSRLQLLTQNPIKVCFKPDTCLLRARMTTFAAGHPVRPDVSRTAHEEGWEDPSPHFLGSTCVRLSANLPSLTENPLQTRSCSLERSLRWRTSTTA